MKKIFATVLSAAMLLMGTQAFAQLSVGAGYLNSQQITKVGDNDPRKVDMNGFYAGVSYNIPIVAGLGIAPGIYGSSSFNGHEDKVAISSVEGARKATTTEIDLNVPVNLTYKFNLTRDLDLFVYGGPIFQYALSNKTNYKYTSNVNTIQGVLDDAVKNGLLPKQHDNFSGDDNPINRFNVYVGGGAGIEVSGIQVMIGYDYCVTNMVKTEDMSSHRSQIKVGVGYAF